MGGIRKMETRVKKTRRMEMMGPTRFERVIPAV